MKKPTDETWRFRIEKLSLAPGDMLVVQCDEEMSHAQAYMIREYLETCTPIGVRVVLIDKKVKLSVLGK